MLSRWWGASWWSDGAPPAEQPPAADALQPPLRSGFRARLRRSVRRYRHNKAGESEKILEYCSYV
jgi:hypothetical protein